MEEEKDDKPSQLVKILRKMPYLEARWILADMDKDLQFDRHVLSSIANGLFELRTFFKDFTESTMQEILPSVPDSSLAYIIKTEARYQTDVKRVLGKDRYFRIEKTEADDEEIAKNNIISAIHTALSEKRLSYHSILLLLKVGPCTKKVFLNREPIHLQMRVLNQMYKPGDMLDVLIYSPDLAGQKAQIFTLKSDSGKEDKRIMFRFDKSGFYFKQIHSGIDPIGFIGLSVPSRGDALLPLLAVSDTQALFTPILESYTYKNKIYHIKLNLHFRDGGNLKRESKIRYIIYCLYCGFPLFISNADNTPEGIEIKFPLPETEPEHKGDYYLHIFYGEHHSGVTLPALHNRYVPPNPIQGEKEVPYSGSYLLHRTDDLFEAKRVNKLLFSGTSFFERKAPVTNWPESPLAISIRKKEIFAFSYLPNISEYKVKRKKALPEKKEGEEKVIYSLYEPHHGGFRRSEVPSASIFHKVPTTYKRISFVPEGSQTSGKPVNVKTLVGEIFIHYVLPFPYYHPAWLVLQQLGSILFKLEPEGKVNNLSDMILSCKNEDGKYGLFGGEGASWKISLDLYDALNLYFSFPIVKPDQKLLELYKQLEVNLKKKLSFLFEPKYNLRDVYKILAYKEGNMLIREGCPYQLPTLCFHLLTKISDKDELSLYRKTKKYQKPITEAASRSIFKKLGVVEEKFETVYEPILEKLEKPVQTLSEFSHFYLLPDFYPAIERLTAFLSFLKNFGNKKLQGQIIEENLEPSLPVQGKYPENSFFISKKLFNKGERGQIQWEKNLRGSYRILFPSFIELFEDSEYIRKGSGIYIKPALFSRPTISFRCKEKGEGAIFILVENDKSEDGFYLWELDTISVV